MFLIKRGGDHGIRIPLRGESDEGGGCVVNCDKYIYSTPHFLMQLGSRSLHHRYPLTRIVDLHIWHQSPLGDFHAFAPSSLPSSYRCLSKF